MAARFSCPQCQAVFTRSAHLRRHQRTHRAEKPYTCAYCNVASTRKDVIVRHTRNFHPGVKPIANQASEETTRPTHPPPAPTEQLPIPRPAREYISSSSSNSSTSSNPDHLSPGLSQREESDLADFGHIDGMDIVPLECPIDFDLFDFSASTLPEAALVNSILAPLTPPSIDHHTESRNSFPRDDDYAQATANFHYYGIHQTSPLKFPSRIATHRFVNAFFKHMASHLPIVHLPTFSIASTASPLLLEIMACGALYRCERVAATTLHATAQQLMLQIDSAEPDSDHDTFDIWKLQTYLLMTYFSAYGGHSYTRRRAAITFSHTIELARQALKNISTLHEPSYEQWVQQETIVRSIATTIEIGAVLASTSKDQCFTTTLFDASFPLPSDEIIWNETKGTWKFQCQQPDSIQVLDCVLAGQKPATPMSELGFVTIVSSILWRVCSLESFACSDRLTIQLDPASKIDNGAQILDSILIEDMSDGDPTFSTCSPLLISGTALLNSMFYHLYGSNTLKETKELLDNPTGVRYAVSEAGNEVGERKDPRLNTALLRAAKSMYSDCQAGVVYIQRTAAHHFGPICATACYEAALLLNYYLKGRESLSLAPEESATLDQLIEEAVLETNVFPGSDDFRNPSNPLLVSAELLSDGSVWQWPCAVSRRLKSAADVTNQLNITSNMIS
ncbi:hypothetical protein BU24DRAFT_497700 [Aaosphaeria arxii CBS 175.79]|uniref:C2H2-type domain-containing protein n=1 Tax=Aaosphaeria arxii CBS 175.79 TaxID=1450172 RepID=A0A6A5X797_9PLEO|nr:uncharacterized protein BU24DRAFT_497700 [Aaosphaeria arxii CBS 175.79]KAF2008791.1 hypothetical protein BU24DRAFT_497700 [Aaosphaeria arxii CBS 175.79]